MKGLYTIIDGSMLDRFDPIFLAKEFLSGGARIIQLRMKKLSLTQIRPIAQKSAELKKEHDFTFIINDHPELVLEVGADGLHLGQQDTDVAHARKFLGPNKIIGHSTHSMAEVADAQMKPVNYIALGAIFPTTAKAKDHPVVGTELLKQVVLASKFPVVAIGGINRDNIDAVLSTGVQMVAMMTALVEGSSPRSNASYFSRLLALQTTSLHTVYKLTK